MRLLSVGDRVGEGRFVVHSRFDRVVNLVAGERLIAVVAPKSGAGRSTSSWRGSTSIGSDVSTSTETRSGSSTAASDAETSFGTTQRFRPGTPRPRP
jgi:hypothetical protein